MNDKKCISPVVATALLLVVAVVAVIGFQSWFGIYSSSIFAKQENSQKAITSGLSIETVVGDQLYVKNGLEDNLSISQIKIGDSVCYEDINLSLGVTNLSVKDCLNSKDGVSVEAVLISNDKVLSKKIYVKDLNDLGVILNQIEYNSTFAQWIGGTGTDYVFDIALDSSNNIYVVGSSTTDITDDGLAAFSGTFDSGSFQGFLLKFDSNGNSLWSQWFGNTGADHVGSVVVDSNDDVYVGGQGYSTTHNDGLVALGGSNSGSQEAFIYKFDSSGSSIWGQWLGGTSIDSIGDLAVDLNDNLWVFGSSPTDITDDGLAAFNGVQSGSDEGFLLKFDTDGNSLLSQWIGGTGSDSISKIDFDSLDNIYLTGVAASDITDDGLVAFNGNYSGGNEMFILKFNSSGSNLWNKWVGNSTSGYINDIVVDNSNNIYIAGKMKNDSATDDNLISFQGVYSGYNEGFISKFDSSGNNLWNQWVGASHILGDEINSLAVDSSNNLYASAITVGDPVDDGITNISGTISGHENLIIRFDSNGNYQWASWFGETTLATETNVVEIDGNDNVWLIGKYETFMGSLDDGITTFSGTRSGDEGFLLRYEEIN